MEEFGDLIAEGLYALFNDGQSLDAATKAYWDDFINARRKLIERLADDLYLIPTHEAVSKPTSQCCMPASNWPPSQRRSACAS